MSAAIVPHARASDMGGQVCADAPAGDPFDRVCLYVRFGAVEAGAPFALILDEVLS